MRVEPAVQRVHLVAEPVEPLEDRVELSVVEELALSHWSGHGDVGGIAELKWIAEYANLHGIMMAPHGTGNGLLGLAALVQVCATLPSNFIAFEYPTGDPAWWYDIVDGLPDPIVRDGQIEVWDRPGMGELNPERTRPHLREEDAVFRRAAPVLTSDRLSGNETAMRV